MAAMKICPRCMRQFDDEVAECPDDGQRLKPFRDSATQLLGTTLDGRWEITEKIGEGGMGEVYRARQVNVDRVVAVKILRLALASSDQYVARFFREADIATAVHHPHFVTIYDFGQTESQLLYIAMELLEGESLAAVLKRRRLELIEALTLAAQVCAALSAAHTARIVHRDLKPDNIFLIDVAEGGIFAKILDFGIAKDLDSEDQVTRTGQLFGTPEYMSPEQCEGAGRVDGRSDLYALGCILYEVLTGRAPFQRDSVIQTLLAQVSDTPRSFGEIGIPCPAGVEQIVMKLLEKHPDNRYGNAIEARQALLAEIDRLRKNSAEIRVYETVSANIPPRNHAARTVSYSDLGHPLQLEGILAASAKSALSKQADKRREADSEKSTDNVATPPETGSRAPLIVAAVAVLCIAAVAVLARPEAPVPEPVVTPPPDLDRRVAKAVTAAASAAAHSHGEDSARRRGSSVALSAATLALTPARSPARPSDGRPKQTEPARAELGIRTPTSMSQRLLAKQGGLLGCYNRREATDDAGDVKFVFDIAPDGTVLSHDVSSATLKSVTVIDCMREVTRGIRFQPAAQGARFEKILHFETK